MNTHSPIQEGVARVLFSAESKDALQETFAILAEECARLSIQACAQFPSASRVGRSTDAAAALRGRIVTQRLHRLQSWIELHLHVLRGAVSGEEIERRRESFQHTRDPDTGVLWRGLSRELDALVTDLRRLEARIERLDGLLHEAG